ncbi:MAG: T9SS type A sorting domain-containing protein [Chitinophagales bacterium]|nr:T9SS type A sorting domain-containing protein [Chitinophagales bacterium]
MKTKHVLAVIMMMFLAFQLNANGNDLIDKNIDLEVKAYPNPAATNVIIKFNKRVDKLEIVDLLGKEILVIEEPQISEDIDIDDFVSNIYIIIATVDNVRSVNRLIVQ